MADPFSIALSGAVTQTQRLAASASNVANQRSTGPLKPVEDGPRAYQPIVAEQVAMAGPKGEPQGTRTVFRPANPAVRAEYQPDAPHADENGLIASPNVDVLRESVERVQALRGYQSNLATLRAADEMERQAIDLTA